MQKGDFIYPQRDHARYLLGMLESGAVEVCPAFHLPFSKNKCRPCRQFVGVDIRIPHCPCHVLGPKEAVRRAWLALEWRGYLK